MKKFACIVLIFILPAILRANVSSYRFAVSQNTYKKLASPNKLFTGYFYNQVSDAIQIDPFKFNGKFYDSLYLCTNGYLSFGPFKPYYTYYPLSQYQFDEGIISAFGNLLRGKSGGSSFVGYSKVGKQLVFEWYDMTRSGSTAESISFQIRLDYSDYSIHFVYGTMTPDNYSYNTQQVGLRGMHYNDYLNLSVDGSSNWNAPEIGSTNKAICYFNSDKPTVKPKSGLSYAFYPSDFKPICKADVANPYDIEHFSPTNAVWDIEEDGNYLWVATYGGILKRHKATGQIVAKYNMNNGLPRNRVTDIEIDANGNVWAACERALAKFDGIKWTIYNSKNTQGALIEDVSRLMVDWYGNLWVGSYWSSRLVKFDGTNWTVQLDGNKTNWGSGILSMELDAYNTMWIGTKNGLIKYDGSNWKWFNTNNSNIGAKQVGSITPGTRDTIWFASDNGVLFLSDTTWGILNKSNTNLPTNAINCVTITPDNKLWAGSWGWGVFRLDNTKWARYTSNSSNLSNNVINCMLVDGNGMLWLGTYQGLNKYTNGKFIPYKQTKEIIGSWVVDVLADKNGNKWFITHDGLSKYDNGTWSSFPVGMWFGRAVFKNDSTLWVIAGDGIMSFNINSYAYSSSKVSNKKLLDIDIDKNGTVWVTTKGEGAAKYNGSGWTFYNTSNSSIADDIVTAVDFDASGNVWFGTKNGVSKYNGSTWTTYDKSAMGVGTNEINDLGVDHNGNIWVAPNWSGVVKFDGSSWKRFSSHVGLISNSIDRIDCQPDTNISWFCSYQGVSRFDGNQFVNYSNDNGLPEEGVNTVLVYKDETWLATQAGASLLSYRIPEVDFYSGTECYPNKTVLSSTSCYTDPSTRYEWDVDNDGKADYFSKNISHVFSSEGKFTVSLKVINGTKSAQMSKTVTVGLLPQISLNKSGKNYICDGKSMVLNTSIKNKDNRFTYHYQWNTGDSSQSIRVDSDGVYKVRVGIDACYSSWDSIELKVKKPYDSSRICMVSVDPATGKNLVIWERQQNRQIESYNIFKLLGNSYSLIGNKAFKDLSIFIDQSTDPTVNAARYALTAIDTCGNESHYSPYHQTIHLGASKGTGQNTAVLDWTDYIDESGLFVPAWYYIYKGKTVNSMVLVDSVSGAFTEWNDNNANGALFYQIGVKKQDWCYPTIIRAQTSSGPYSQSLSNLKDYGQQANAFLQVSPEYQVVPNTIGASATYNIYSFSDSITVSCAEDWLDISFNAEAKFFIATCNSLASSDREASITVSAPGLEDVQVMLKQSYTNSIEQNSNPAFVKIYPNPSKGTLHLRSDKQMHALVIHDIYGQELYKQSEINSSWLQLDLSRFPSGMYVLTLEVDNQLITKSFQVINAH